MTSYNYRGVAFTGLRIHSAFVRNRDSRAFLVARHSMSLELCSSSTFSRMITVNLGKDSDTSVGCLDYITKMRISHHQKDSELQILL